MTRTARTLLSAISLTLIAGCAAPRDAEPVARAQLEAVALLAEAHQRDLSALNAAVAALLEIERETIAGALERHIAADLLTPAGAADLPRLDAFIAGADYSNPLAAEVLAQRMTAPAAHTWLTSYAAAWTSPAGGAHRRQLIAELFPIAQRAAAASALLDALDARAALSAQLAADALHSAHDLLAFTGHEPDAGVAARAAALELWSAAALDSIHDPDRRAAADRAMTTLLDLLLPAATPITQEPLP